ncbi:hypothetical protein U27_04825 [Candidatus Vecturithrix granuli]|uniref:Uncharacterized protein n=1 Tax=Vecturithrix granuli TaxID=1499967 RepID=A0A081BZU8_VECG1|nr:hypothetical protein U27_04825 [Candidatus Vecturithrix granuli]
MAKKYRVTVTEKEREQLESVVKKRNPKAIQVKRAYILLAADERGKNGGRMTRVGQRLGSVSAASNVFGSGGWKRGLTWRSPARNARSLKKNALMGVWRRT